MALGVVAMMAIWWATEALPVPVTAMMPLILFPLLGIGNFKATASSYAHPLIFLFLGGFILGQGMQRWNLHRRMALTILTTVTRRRDIIVLAFMGVTAFLSMWISNTATTVMMLPIAASVVGTLFTDEKDAADPANLMFGTCLMLALAYAASIGGMGTLIGTPPNAFMAAFFSDQYGIEISFQGWMTMAVPVSFIILIVAWLLLTRVLFAKAIRGEQAENLGDYDTLHHRLSDMGRMTQAEMRVGLVFILAASLWMTRPLLDNLPALKNLTDSGIAIFCASLLFFLPAGKDRPGERVLNWEYAQKLPWGVLLLFGGGLAIAGAVKATDLDTWIGGGLETFGTWPLLLFILIIAGVVLMMTEFASNAATVATVLPIIAVLAQTVGLDPIQLAAPAVMAASCAFMLPAATPPNALVFGSGYLTIAQMIRAGVFMNLVSLLMIAVAGYFLVPMVFGP